MIRVVLITRQSGLVSRMQIFDPSVTIEEEVAKWQATMPEDQAVSWALEG